MSNDERKNKLIAENKFYLELKYTHDGDLKALLSPEECSILGYFPDKHQRLFSRRRDWQWELVRSVQVLAGSPKCHEVAETKFKIYQGIRGNCSKRLRVEELSNLLFPLIDIDDGYFVEEITEAIRDGVEDPILLLNMEAESWEEFEVFNYPINIKWLESRDSEYLRLCAEVWRGYLGSVEKSSEHDTPDGLSIPWLLGKGKRRLPGQVVEAAYRLFRQRNRRNHQNHEELFMLISPENLPELVEWRNEQKTLKAINIRLNGGKPWDYKKFLDVYNKMISN